MNTVTRWYIRNQDAISWFLIGMMTSNAIDSLANHQYTSAAVSAALAFLNYKLSKIRL